VYNYIIILMEYIRSFVIGSSIPVVLIFYLVFFSIPIGIKKYTNEQYAIVAPVYFGLMNMTSLFVANLLGLSLRSRLLITSIVSIIYVLTFVKLNNLYVFTNNFQLVAYVSTIIIFHLMTFNVIIFGLEQSV
jgi:hypothetical protein